MDKTPRHEIKKAKLREPQAVQRAERVAEALKDGKSVQEADRG